MGETTYLPKYSVTELSLERPDGFSHSMAQFEQAVATEIPIFRKRAQSPTPTISTHLETGGLVERLTYGMFVF